MTSKKDTEKPRIVPPTDIEFGTPEATADRAPSTHLLNPQSTSTSPNAGLERVAQEAIDTFANQVGEYLKLQDRHRMLAAYFAVPYAPGRDTAKFQISSRMKGADAAEALHRFLGATISDAAILERILGKPLDSSESKVTIPMRRFPEVADLHAYFYGRQFPRNNVNVYVQLLALPPRGRTFYAGLLKKANANKDWTVDSYDPKNIRLGVTTLQVIEYAKEIGVPDFEKYLGML